MPAIPKDCSESSYFQMKISVYPFSFDPSWCGCPYPPTPCTSSTTPPNYTHCPTVLRGTCGISGTGKLRWVDADVLGTLETWPSSLFLISTKPEICLLSHIFPARTHCWGWSAVDEVVNSSFLLFFILPGLLSLCQFLSGRYRRASKTLRVNKNQGQ